MGQSSDTTIDRREPRQSRHCLAPTGVFSRVGPGYQTCPDILSAMGVLRRDLAHAKEALVGVRDAFAADGGDGDELPQVGDGLAGTSRALDKEISVHRVYLVSGEPERLAAEDE